MQHAQSRGEDARIQEDNHTGGFILNPLASVVTIGFWAYSQKSHPRCAMFDVREKHPMRPDNGTFMMVNYLL